MLFILFVHDCETMNISMFDAIGKTVQGKKLLFIYFTESPKMKTSRQNEFRQ